MTTREYAYVITVTADVFGEGTLTATYADTLTWSGDRMSAFYDRLDHARIQMGSDLSQTFVLFWSFEPNDL